MICFPNAKINLGLNIVSKRNDGYHNISSLLFPIPYYDILEFIPSKSFRLNTYGFGSNIPEKENLVSKAWTLMHQNYRISGLHIKLLKQIPIGSGLGGGSADAAFFITTLNEFFDLNLSSAELQDIAIQIGSDCPFFILNKPAIVSGIGELIDTVEFNLEDKFLVVVIPATQISSKEAYAKVNPSESEIPISEIIKQPINTWREALINEFEKPIFAIYPELEITKLNLYNKGAAYASLTGSGSAIYAIFNEFPALSKKDIGFPFHCFNGDNQIC